MPTTRKKATRKTSTRKQRNPEPIAMLEADHRKVQQMFKQFEKLGEGDEQEKGRIVKQACGELKVHAQLEEELFYPPLHEEEETKDLIDEAQVEHQSAKDLIAKLEEMDPDDELFDATFTVLAEYVRHHVQEEEGEIFPAAKRAQLDWESMATQMTERKSEIAAELGVDEEEEEPMPSRGSRSTARSSTRNGSRR